MTIAPGTTDRHPTMRRPHLLWVAMLLAGGQLGCRNHAYQDVYNDKLTSELRVLEDQLYEADYENQVLRQKLHRAELAQGQAERPAAPTPRRRSEPSPSDDSLPAPRQSTTPEAADEPDLEVEIDMGVPVDEEGVGPPQSDAEAGNALPPVQVLPPRAEEFESPQIELGEPVPPGGVESPEELPPGQIPTPESARLLVPPEPPLATSVAIHPGLSGGHHQDSDNELDGLFVVLTVRDAEGEVMLAEGPVSIVVLDPSREGEEARLGRWDFTAEEIAAHRRDNPLPSIQLPLLWQDTKPAGEEVAIFVRFDPAAPSPLETDMLLRFRETTTADWSARGLGSHTSGPRAAGLRTPDLWK